MRTTCTTGVVCGPGIWRKLIAMRRRSTSAETPGWARAGIGIPGMMPIRSSLETDSYMIRSVGASFHRGLSLNLRSFSLGTFTITLIMMVAFIAVAAFTGAAASTAAASTVGTVAASMAAAASTVVVAASTVVGAASTVVAAVATNP